MADPIATRYAQTLFEAAQAGGRLDETQETLSLIEELLKGHPELRRLLLIPAVELEDKLGIVGRLLAGSWSADLQAFVRLVLAFGRAAFLPEIAEAFRDLVDADQGRLRVSVRSAQPLPEGVLKRLRGALERREGKQIELHAELAPEVLGGLQIRLDHRVIDGTLQGQLAELRQRLTSVRVH
ncbi:MAG: ATP synthase F1 subunit delta [Candidatus Omnitrophota bacterium]|nr:ATP synthase F1 subunit delta [Candidatus Omnitrophota bacterium]